MGMQRPTKRTKAVVALSSDDDHSQSQHPESSKSSNTRARSSVHNRKNVSPAKCGTKGSPKTGGATSKRSDGAIGLDPEAKNAHVSRPGKAVNGRINANTKPIYSFFNVATKEGRLQPGASPEKLEYEMDMAVEEDVIEDDDSPLDVQGSEKDARLEKDYALPNRHKRKLAALDEKYDCANLPRGSQLFRKTSITSSNDAERDQPAEDKRPWVERFSPTSIEELAVHKRKVQDVQSWVSAVTAGKEQKSVLVLKGPPGSGKTAALTLIAERIGLRIQEWKNPSHPGVSGDGYVSMAAQFEDFIARAGAFGALATSDESRQAQNDNETDSDRRREVILIEEFPNTFTRTSTPLQTFRSAVLQYLAASLTIALPDPFRRPAAQGKSITPIVMIISETYLSTATAANDSFSAHRLLGPDILTHPGVTVIEFNPIAPTFMMKALELVLRKESRKSGRRKAPGPVVLNHLSDLGDIRSAISTLEFLCLRGDDHDGWSGRISFSKGKHSASSHPASKAELDSLESITQRESTLGIFHAVGKIVHNKREVPPASDTLLPQPPAFLPQHARPKASEVNVETVLNELGTDVQIFIAALHENYALSCGGLTSEDTLDSINGCLQSLSDADILCPDRFSNRYQHNTQGTPGDSLRQDEISFQTGVRGLLFSLPHPVKRLPLPADPSGNRIRTQGGRASGAYQMFYPKSQQLWRRIEEKEELLEQLLVEAQKRSDKSEHLSTASAHTKSGGVEGWRKHQGFSGLLSPDDVVNSNQKPQHHDDVALAASEPILKILSKAELLLERFPYMAMLEKKRHGGATSKLLKDLEKLTQITGTSARNDVADQDDDDSNDLGEQWSTDKPGEEPVSPSKRFRPGTKSNGTATFASLPHKTEQLVLSDDDIEDD